jgi:hypothetical protein
MDFVGVCGKRVRGNHHGGGTRLCHRRDRASSRADDLHESIDTKFENMLRVSAHQPIIVLPQAHMWIITNRPYPTRVFSEETEAVAWCAEIVGDADVCRAR